MKLPIDNLTITICVLLNTFTEPPNDGSTGDEWQDVCAMEADKATTPKKSLKRNRLARKRLTPSSTPKKKKAKEVCNNVIQEYK